MPDFSRKHYERIAGVIDAVRTQGAWSGFDTQAEAITVRLADVFEADNAQFDRIRFLEACGIGIPKSLTTDEYGACACSHGKSDHDLDPAHPACFECPHESSHHAYEQED